MYGFAFHAAISAFSDVATAKYALRASSAFANFARKIAFPMIAHLFATKTAMSVLRTRLPRSAARFGHRPHCGPYVAKVASCALLWAEPDFPNRLRCMGL